MSIRKRMFKALEAMPEDFRDWIIRAYEWKYGYSAYLPSGEKNPQSIVEATAEKMAETIWQPVHEFDLAHRAVDEPRPVFDIDADEEQEAKAEKPVKAANTPAKAPTKRGKGK